MLTFKTISETINKSKENECPVDIGVLAEALNLEYVWAKQDRIKAYWMGGWQCTDTPVGYAMYFFDGEPVCISSQVARKDDIIFEWFSESSADKVRNYILELAKDTKPNVQIISLNDELLEGYKINFNSQILYGTKVFHNGQSAEIIAKFKHTEYGVDTIVKIQYEDGKVEVVDIQDLEFKFNLDGLQNQKASFNIETLIGNKESKEVELKKEKELDEMFKSMQKKIRLLDLEECSRDFEFDDRVVTVTRLEKKNLDLIDPLFQHEYLVEEEDKEEFIVIYQEQFDKLQVEVGKINDLKMALNIYLESKK